MNFTDLMYGQMKAAQTNAKENLRFVLADAKAGIAGSIYKRATEEVDFFSMTMSNLSENDVENFEYGLSGLDDEGNYTFFQGEEDGTNTYLQGMDRRLIDREIPEELQHRFEPQGHEIVDLNALYDFEERVAQLFDTNPSDVKRFKIHGESFHDVIQTLPNRFKMKEWIQRALVHMHPQSYHNKTMNEYVVRVFKPDPYVEGGWVAKIPTIRDGQKVFMEYEVDLEESRRGSEELPTDEQVLEFPDGVPMIGSTREVYDHNYRGETFVKTVIVLKRGYQRGLRVAVQDIGSSGIRMPAQSEKYYRPTSVTASKEANIKVDDVWTLPFADDKPSVINAMPFTMQVDDLIRLTHIFDAEDLIEVTYMPTIDAGSTIPIRFESLKEFDTRDDEGRKHYIRKIAFVAAVRPVVNGKVVIQ